MRKSREDLFLSRLPALLIIAAGIIIGIMMVTSIVPSLSRNRNTAQPILLLDTGAHPTAVKIDVTPSVPLKIQGVTTNSGNPAKDCTYTSQYWSNNPSHWISTNIVIGGITYTKADILKVLQGQSQSLPSLMQKQFFTATLNTLNGADSKAIANTIVQASGWIDSHPLQTNVPSADVQKGTDLLNALETYNSGVTGPGLCPDSPAVAAVLAPTPSSTAGTITSSSANRVQIPYAGRATSTRFSVSRQTPVPPTSPGTSLPPSTQATTLPQSLPVSTPLPTNTFQPPSSTSTPQPTSTPAPTTTPRPTNTPVPPTSGNIILPTSTSLPTNTPQPTNTTAPTSTSAPPTQTPIPPTNTAAPAPSDTPLPPTSAPPTSLPPTDPLPTNAPAPTTAPQPTSPPPTSAPPTSPPPTSAPAPTTAPQPTNPPPTSAPQPTSQP